MIRFYLQNPKKILVSNHPVEKVQKKIGHSYEILISIQELSAVDVIKERLLRSYPQAEFIEYFVKERRKFSEETKRKMSLAMLGKPRPQWVKDKISQSKKGVSQFAGKRHTEETKRKMALKKLGNDHAKNTIWAHDPRGTEEQRVKSLLDIKPGFSQGRDYYSVEPGLYYFYEYNKTK